MQHWYRQRERARVAWRADPALCYQCGQKRADDRKACASCRAKENRRRKEQLQKQRQQQRRKSKRPKPPAPDAGNPLPPARPPQISLPLRPALLPSLRHRRRNRTCSTRCRLPRPTRLRPSTRRNQTAPRRPNQAHRRGAAAQAKARPPIAHSSPICIWASTDRCKKPIEASNSRRPPTCPGAGAPGASCMNGSRGHKNMIVVSFASSNRTPCKRKRPPAASACALPNNPSPSPSAAPPPRTLPAAPIS